MFKKFIYILLFLFFSIISPANASDFKIVDVKTDYSGNLIVLKGNRFSSEIKYSAGFSQNPLRAYIDLDDCILVETKKTLEFKNNPITKVAIAQFSAKPNKVRLVFYANSPEDLQKIKLIKNGNSLTFKMNDFSYAGKAIPLLFSDLLPKEYKDAKYKDITDAKFQKYIMTNVQPASAGLLVSGIGNLKLARPFILTDPIRIVFDLQNAVALKREFYGEHKFENGDIIKIGQFNADTLRFVITTNNPVAYKSFVSPDLQSIFITNIVDETKGALPNTNILSALKKINLKVNSPTETYIAAMFDKPIITSFRRTHNKFLIDFLNVDYHANADFFRAKTTGQFGGFTVQKMTPESDKLSVLFPVNDDLKVEAGLSVDGKILIIRLTQVQEMTEKNDKPTVQFPKEKPVIKPLKNKVIVIDAGHGGKDVGAISGKMYEKHASLDMALMLQKYLEEKGAKVIMTRKNDTYLTLQDRVSISNYENADLFVSIHLNSSEKSQINGIETHWYKENSKDLARYVQNHLISNVNANDRGLFKSMFYVINHTTAPAILVETGFISNQEERNELFKKDRQDATAKAIADGILEYFAKR